MRKNNLIIFSSVFFLLTGTGYASAEALSDVVLSGKIVPVVDDKQIEMAHCYLPDGWDMKHEESWCTLETGVFTPGRMFIQEESEGDLLMGYYSPCSFDDYVQLIVNGMDVSPQMDGVYDTDYMIQCKKFMEANAYCDYMADYMTQNMVNGVTLSVVSESEPDERARTALEEKRTKNHQESASTFKKLEKYMDRAATDGTDTDITITGSYCDQHQKEYSFMINGVEYRLIVNAQVSGVQITTKIKTPLIYGDGCMEASQVMNFWTVDSVHYSVMPLSKAAKQRSVFEQFVLNTRVSDEYMSLLGQISEKLLEAIARGRNTEISVYYSELDIDTAIEYGLADSTYDDDSYSDYILDQNEYVTSSGEEVKVSTAFDYVFEDGKGNIVASNSILDDMERLYPNP